MLSILLQTFKTSNFDTVYCIEEYIYCFAITKNTILICHKLHVNHDGYLGGINFGLVYQIKYRTFDVSTHCMSLSFQCLTWLALHAVVLSYLTLSRLLIAGLGERLCVVKVKLVHFHFS